MTEVFANWTEYDDWIVAHYKDYDVYSLNEIEDGKVKAEFCDKGEMSKLFPKEESNA